MTAHGRRPREIVSQPIEETDQQPFTEIQEPIETSPADQMPPPDLADRFEEDGLTVSEVAEDLSELAAEADAEGSSLYDKLQALEAGSDIEPPNWFSLRARLKNDPIYPLKTEAPKRGERLASAVSGLSKLPRGHKVMVRLDTRPYDSDQYEKYVDSRIFDLTHDKEGAEIKLDDKQKVAVKLWEGKSDQPGHLEVALSMTIIAPDSKTSKADLERMLKGAAKTFAHQYANGKHQAIFWEQCDPVDALTGRLLPAKQPLLRHRRFATGRSPMILGTEEAAALFHVPDSKFQANGIRRDVSQIIRLTPTNPLPTIPEADLDHPTNNLIVWGIENKGSTSERIVGQNIEQLNQHSVIAGATGSGKSELAMWRFTHVACARNGTRPQAGVLLDPHGELGIGAMTRVITQVPERIPDLVHMDAADPTHTVVWNPLAIEHSAAIDDRAQIEHAVDAVMDLVRPFAFNQGNAPAAEALARLVFGALAEANLHLENQKLSPFDAVPFLTDEEFRTRVMQFSTSTVADAEFGADIGKYHLAKPDKQAERNQVIIRVLGSWEGLNTYRRMLGSGMTKFDPAAMMAQDKLLIFRGARFSGGLAKKLGEMLTRMIIKQLLWSLHSWGRYDDPLTGERRDGGAIILGDEAATWINMDICVLLAEARKYNVGVELYVQFLSQIVKAVGIEVLNEVMGNTATKGSLRLDPNKTDKIESSIAPGGELKPADFAQMPNYHSYQRVLLPGGLFTGPMVSATPPPLDKRLLRDRNVIAARETIDAQSRELMSLPNDQLDELWAERQDRTALEAEMKAAIQRLGGPPNLRTQRLIAEQEAADRGRDMSQDIEHADPSRVADIGVFAAAEEARQERQAQGGGS